ncbi:universal stress protein [Arthrobacter sp. NPDC056493]|uniref:universal stress protein n=1 Tax=Arthrobacter sp. NPDC056493 TaxID=3345839 RepID=UPI00366C9900
MLGVGWGVSEHLVRTAAAIAAALGQHLVCAFVDPAGYLAEWEPEHQRTALSLEPASNEEAHFPSQQLRRSLESVLGQPGETWSYRVLDGDVAKALIRLAENTDASLLVAGAGGAGALARIERLLEGSVSAALIHRQPRPVLIVPRS